jgi:hypothetical protein
MVMKNDKFLEGWRVARAKWGDAVAQEAAAYMA